MGNLNADKLRELKKLLDERVITKEEFDEKKKEFLEEISEPDIEKDDESNENLSNTFDSHNGDVYSEGEVSDENSNDDEDSQDEDDDSSNDSDNGEYNNPTPQNNGYKIGIAVVAIVAIVAIFGIYMNHKNNTENTANSTNTAQTQKSETSPEEWKSFDDESWEDFKEINQKYNELKDTVKDTSNPDREVNINKAKEYFSNESNSLNYGQNNDQNKYLGDMKDICQKAENICDEALKAKDSGNQSDFDILKEKLNKIENQIESFTKTRPEILQKAGYTEDQIKDMIDKIKADLGIH